MSFKRTATAMGALVAASCAGAEAWAQEQETLDLPTVTVEGSENTGFFGEGIAQSAGSAMKMDTPIMETARSVDVVTQQQMQDRGVTTVSEALRYLPGVMSSQYGVDNRADWGVIRGFDATNYQDGLQTRFGYYNIPRPETFLLDTVTVLKGPAGVLYGAGSVGGVVNITSKLPDPFAPNIVQFQAGTNSLFQAGIDYNGQIDAEGKWNYRLVGLGRTADGSVNYSKNDVAAFMPSLTWAPTADTSITLLGLYQKTETSPEIQFLSPYGTLYPGPNGEYLDRDTFVGEPGFDRYDVEQRSATLFLEHQFNPIWSMAGTFRRVHSDTDYNQAWWAYDNDDNFRYNADGTINRTVYGAEKQLDYWAGDLHAEADFTVKGVRNQVMFGLAGLDSTYDDDYGYGVQGGPIDPFDPVYTGLAVPVSITDYPELNVRQDAVYVQDRLTINQRIFVDLGLRYDWIRSDQQTFDAENSISSNADSEPSRSASILYAAENGLSPYVSYAETFNQEITGTDAEGNPFKPTRGTQYEVGVKYQPPGTSSILTAAVFNITKSNMAVTDLDNPAYSIQIGEAKSRGLELGAQANYRDISVDAAYTYLDTEDEYGNPLPAVPNHFASLWLGYRPQGRLSGWKGGVGVRYNGESWVEGVTTPSSTLYDAMLGYETDRYDVTVTGSNIADTTYLNACSPVDCFYGQSRTINLTVTAKF